MAVADCAVIFVVLLNDNGVVSQERKNIPEVP